MLTEYSSTIKHKHTISKA